MKRFFMLLVLALGFAGCDDGDLEQVSFEFDDTDARACNTGENDFFIFKTTDKRALMVVLDESLFPNEVSADNTTTPITINNTSVKLIYRVYASAITDATVCSDIPASDPVVTEEYVAVAGQILINTTAIKTEVAEDGSTKITYYLHTLSFNDVTFDLGEGNQRNESLPQITYQTTAPTFQLFSANIEISNCEGDNSFLFKSNNEQSLILNLSDATAAALFSAEAGPKTQLFDAENTLTYRFYDTTPTFNIVTEGYLCTSPTPEFPVVNNTWTAAPGVANVSGIIEVTTLPADDGFTHTITLRNVRMTKESLSFQLPTDYFFGEFETPN